MKTVAIANHKGGCGKTTTAINAASALARRGWRVLLVDLDPQAHATLGLGVNPRELTQTVGDALLNCHLPIAGVMLGAVTESLHVVPGCAALASAESAMYDLLGKEFVLREILCAASADFDLCIVDCPPSFGILTTSALVASTHVVVPVQPHYYASGSIARLTETIQALTTRLSPCAPRLCGIVMTFVEEQPTHVKRVCEQLRETFGDAVFDTVIHKAAKLVEAADVGRSILAHAPGSRAALEYEALAEEITARLVADKPQRSS